MALVRSEHDNDQGVQTATEALNTAERDLEGARSLLERLERKQYHEEQIWSDTIRRNSTWLTFGLMGANILLLLAQIAIFEPYRRKKIVRDVKLALDERSFEPSSEVQRRIDEATARGETESNPSNNTDIWVPPAENTGKMTLVAGEIIPGAASSPAAAVSISDDSPLPSEYLRTKPSTPRSYREALRDRFSNRLVEMRMVEVTNTALQGAATGVAMMGILFLVFRPR